jgi:hypothetical protein
LNLSILCCDLVTTLWKKVLKILNFRVPAWGGAARSTLRFEEPPIKKLLLALFARKGPKMTNSKRVAGLVGPTLVAIAASEMINPDIWSAVTAPVTYQAGTLLFVAGLAIVSAHNRWTWSWPVIVTLVGWFAMGGGLFRMFAPALAQRGAQNAGAVLAVQIALLAIGLVLTFKAVRRDGDRASDR